MVEYLLVGGMMPRLQSAYRRHHHHSILLRRLSGTVRLRWNRIAVDQIVLVWSDSAGSIPEYPIGYGSSDLLGASRLGPRSVAFPAVHSGIDQHHWRSRSESALVCGRFPNLPQRACHGGIGCCWSSRAMYGVCRTVDGKQSFATKRGQNSADLDWYKAAAIENHHQRNSAAVCDCNVQLSCHKPWCIWNKFSYNNNNNNNYTIIVLRARATGENQWAYLVGNFTSAFAFRYDIY